MVYCSNCGKIQDDTVKFCSNCGNSLINKNKSNQENTSSGNNIQENSNEGYKSQTSPNNTSKDNDDSLEQCCLGIFIFLILMIIFNFVVLRH